MDTLQRTLLAEYEAEQRQAQFLLAANRWYLYQQTPVDSSLRAALAELLLILAAWIAPAGNIKEAARILARG